MNYGTPSHYQKALRRSRIARAIDLFFPQVAFWLSRAAAWAAKVFLEAGATMAIRWYSSRGMSNLWC
jgi:hypothetical protein